GPSPAGTAGRADCAGTAGGAGPGNTAVAGSRAPARGAVLSGRVEPGGGGPAAGLYPGLDQGPPGARAEAAARAAGRARADPVGRPGRLSAAGAAWLDGGSR